MHYAAEKLDQREGFDAVHIDSEGEDHYGPHDQCSVPSLRNIVWIVQNDESLNLGCDEEADTGDCCLPGEDGNPSYPKLLIWILHQKES